MLLCSYHYENEYEYDIQKNVEYNKIYDNYLYLENKSFHLLKQESIGIEKLKENFLNNAYNMNGLFAGCSSLKELPDISKWNLSSVKDISNLFSGCSSLKELPDISKWNTENIKNLK